MGRLPFNPDRIAGPPSKSGSAKDATMTVGQLSAMIASALAEALPRKVRVVGEVSNLSDRNHWFFTLKDEQASLRCVCFASVARKVSFPVQDGLQVVATGRIDYYPAQGSLQLYVDKLEPVGQGALELRLRALMAELREAGYFEADRKLPLPTMPTRVAVVTSAKGAALQDVINTAGRRWGGCQLLLYDVLVQGESAAPQIADAIRRLSRAGKRLGLDAIILTRGGGSIEDLWAFNERIVADAIYDCPIPIVAAIGHETDTTVAELVADVRCATPTQAAMTLIPDREALGQQVDQLGRRLTLLLKRQRDHAMQRLAAAARSRLFRRPDLMTQPLKQRLQQAAQRLHTGVPRFIKSQGEQLAAVLRHLEAVGPRNVLQRGYSYTLDGDDKVVRSIEQVAPGDRITTVLADGRIVSDVVDGDAAAEKPTGGEVKPKCVSPKRKAASNRARDTSGGGDTSGGPGLFG